MKDCFLATENVNRFDTLCAEMADRRSLLGSSMAMVTGHAGRGKSESAKRFAVNSEAVYIPPMIKTSATMLLQEITLDLAKVKPGRISGCLEVIQGEMARNRRLIIIDEADLIPIEILEMLRNINERYACPILLIGEDALKNKVTRISRLSSRIRRRMEFEPVVPQNIVLFFRKALEMNINGAATALIHKYSEGDWRPVLNIAADIERACEASGLREIPEELVRGIIEDKG
jgi:type II secretory pathway predicted ATPase ExeA